MRYIDFGDYMKNIFAGVLSVTLAILIGSLFMNVSTKNPEPSVPVSSDTSLLKAFQVGAFSTLESAQKEADIKNGKVIKEGDKYLVYVSILRDAENIEKMIQYLNTNNYYYYIKNITASESFKEELYKYEELMKATTSNIAFLELNKRILDNYEV